MEYSLHGSTIYGGIAHLGSPKFSLPINENMRRQSTLIDQTSNNIPKLSLPFGDNTIEKIVAVTESYEYSGTQETSKNNASKKVCKKYKNSFYKIIRKVMVVLGLKKGSGKNEKFSYHDKMNGTNKNSSFVNYNYINYNSNM